MFERIGHGVDQILPETGLVQLLFVGFAHLRSNDILQLRALDDRQAIRLDRGAIRVCEWIILVTRLVASCVSCRFIILHIYFVIESLGLVLSFPVTLLLNISLEPVFIARRLHGRDLLARDRLLHLRVHKYVSLPVEERYRWWLLHLICLDLFGDERFLGFRLHSLPEVGYLEMRRFFLLSLRRLKASQGRQIRVTEQRICCLESEISSLSLGHEVDSGESSSAWQTHFPVKVDRAAHFERVSRLWLLAVCVTDGSRRHRLLVPRILVDGPELHSRALRMVQESIAAQRLVD